MVISWWKHNDWKTKLRDTLVALIGAAIGDLTDFLDRASSLVSGWLS